MIAFLAQWLGERYSYQMGLSVIAFLETLSGVAVFIFPLKHKPQYVVRATAGIALMAAIMIGRAILRTHFQAMLWSRFLGALMEYLSVLPLLFLAHEGTWCKRLKTWCAGCAAVQIAGSLYALVLSFTGADDTQTMTLFPQITNVDVTLLIWFVFHLAVCYLLRLLFIHPSVQYHEDRKSQIQTTWLCILFLLASVLINAVMSEYRADSRPLYEMLRCCLVFMCISVLALHHDIVLFSQHRAEIEVMDQVLAENRRQYETMKANIDLVNLRCHDLRHQLDKLQSRLTESEISALREAIDLYDSNVKTGNEVLDVVLYSTMLKCMESGIAFTSMADGECLSFMRTRHIYALFSNALDNAVEAVMRVSNPEKRVISLHVRRLSGAVEIAVMNYYEGEIKFKNDLPQTRKPDGRRHGFGTSSMQYIVSQYGGTMKISAKDSVYLLEIRLNIPEKAEKTKGN